MTEEERKETEVPDWLKAKPYYNEAFIDFIENVCDKKLSVCQKDVCCYTLKKVAIPFIQSQQKYHSYVRIVAKKWK